MPLLEVKNIVLKFGGLTVINNMSMNIEEGSIMSLIGRTVPARPRSSIPSPASTSPTRVRSTFSASRSCERSRT